MKLDLPLQRLKNQQLLDPALESPADVVGWFGAMQAQDYAASLWAVGVRAQKPVLAAVEEALAKGAIIRTWPMRGTLHYVCARDAAWMLKHLTPRVIAGFARRYRDLELDADTFKRARTVVEKALGGGRQLARPGLYARLEAGGVSTAGSRGLYILSYLAQQRVICYGPPQGKQQSIVLFDEWVRGSRKLSRDEALGELAGRYFRSRGPASLQDFAWWAGLSRTDAAQGLKAVEDELSADSIGGQKYWLRPGPARPRLPASRAWLLPVYDEYAVGYNDRSAVLAPAFAMRKDSGKGVFRPPIVIDGQIVGTWRRTLKKAAVSVQVNLFRELNCSEQAALAQAADAYGAFLGAPAELAG